MGISPQRGHEANGPMGFRLEKLEEILTVGLAVVVPEVIMNRVRVKQGNTWVDASGKSTIQVNFTVYNFNKKSKYTGNKIRKHLGLEYIRAAYGATKKMFFRRRWLLFPLKKT